MKQILKITPCSGQTCIYLVKLVKSDRDWKIYALLH